MEPQLDIVERESKEIIEVCLLQKNSLPEKQDKSSVGSLRFLELFTETFRDVLTAVLTHTSTNISTALFVS